MTAANVAMCPACGRIIQGLERLPADEQRRDQVLSLLNEGLEMYAETRPCPVCAQLTAQN
jgi:hypothetical protein